MSLKRDTEQLTPWMRDAAVNIYKNLRGYFKDYGLEDEKNPPIDNIAFDIWTAYTSKPGEEQGNG